MQQENSLNQSTVPPHPPVPLPIYSIATTALSATSSVPASVIVSSSAGTALQRDLGPNQNLAPAESKGTTLIPQFSAGHPQQALPCQVALTCRARPPASACLPSRSPAELLSNSFGLSPVEVPLLLCAFLCLSAGREEVKRGREKRLASLLSSCPCLPTFQSKGGEVGGGGVTSVTATRAAPLRPKAGRVPRKQLSLLTMGA